MPDRQILGRYFSALFALASLLTSIETAAQTAPEKPPVTKLSPTATDSLKVTKKKLDAARTKKETLQRKTHDLKQDIQRIRKGLVVAAQSIQHHEQRVGELGARLSNLNIRQQRFKKLFKARRRQLGTVLAALQRMARNPPEALIAQPIPPADMVRTAILLRAVLPQLKGKARELGQNLASLNAAREEAKVQRVELDDELGKLEEQRLVLKRLLGRKSRLRRRTVQQTKAAGRQANALAKRAASLQDLVARLNQLRDEQDRHHQPPTKTFAPKPRPVVTTRPPKGFTAKPFESRIGQMPFPVVGQVIARYGQTIASGRIHKGLTIETASSAQIIAPYEGKVVFSGPFRGYGQLLIIEHSGGYHTLLAGMERIDAAVGQWLLVGEPTGVMGRIKPVNVKGRRRYQKPALYVEFRRKGQPVDPLAWLAARKGKVSG